MGAGRPTLYRKEYCDEVVDLGKQGKSLVQMAAHFDVSRSTIDQWSVDNAEFSEALNRAKAHAQDWWERAAQENLALPGFNAAVWKKSVEARFREDYTERREFTGKDGGPIATDSTHHGSIAISDTAAFIANALGNGTKPTPE